jgi:hypothetical protein
VYPRYVLTAQSRLGLRLLQRWRKISRADHAEHVQTRSADGFDTRPQHADECAERLVSGFTRAAQ